MSDLGVDGVGAETRLALIESSLGSALGDTIGALGSELMARIEAKLSGGVLATKSGALLASLSLDEEIAAPTFLAHVASRGVPYAGIQEYGGRTEAHDIVAIKAKALAFVTDGKTAFAKSVHHPGSVIPPHSFMRGTLDEMHDEIVAAFKAALGAAIQ
jgi:hypothetical protein